MNKLKLAQTNNIQPLDTRSKHEKNLENMKELLPHVINEWELKAKFLKRKYDRLVKEGFTPEQAMEIIKTRPIFE